ncbi:thiamine-phosphate kinase [bacterium]|nr:thiamine-phosphate kinase [bacterium]
MDEEKIIEFINNNIKIKNKDVILGPGDDTAVLKYDATNYLLLTTDSVVENVHFKRDHATLYQIGKKAMAVNLSDISAMGGTPLYALVSVGFPDGTKNIVAPLLRGMEKMSSLYNFDIVGGNISKAPVLFIDVTMAGIVEKKYLKLRSGACVGDNIYVTGKLGGTILKKHLNIVPRIKESRILIKRVNVTSMMDISDGLSTDLTRLAKASKTGFRLWLDKVPTSADAIKMSSSKKEAIAHALNDGEDYELLFTVPSSCKKDVPAKIGNTIVTCVGVITEERKFEGVYQDEVVKIEPSGFSHF